MAITSENYKKAEDWLSKAKSDPSVNKSKIAQIEQDLRSFYEGESSGALPTTSQSAPAARRSGIAGYYYEPSVEEFRNAITNPEVQKSLNLQDRFKNDYIQPVGEKTLSNNELLDPNTYVGSTAKLDPKYLGEDSSEYKAYADYAYNKEKTNNPNLHRYSDLDITTSPFKKALGAAIKYGPAAVLGAEKSIALGIPRKTASVVAGNIPNSAADTEYDAMGAPSGGEYHPEKAERVIKSVEDLESLSPGANTAGNFAGYAVPIAPANLAARGMMSSLGYETAGPLTKAAISGLTGSTVASGEGAAQDIIDNPGISGQELWDNTKPRAFWGGVAGSALDLVAQGAGRTQKAIEESPRWSPIKNQKDIGGDTNFITGIQTTPEVRENVRLGTGPRQNVTPQDIAAQKVAPQFRESIDLKNTNARKTVDATLEEYLNRPEIASQQESMQPVAEGILDMFSKGTFEGAVTGDIKHSNQGAVDTFKKALMSIGEIAHMAPEEAALYAKNNNGIMLSPKQLKGLGITSEAGKVPVYVASKTNARALLEMEGMIDEKLKMAGTEGGINNPIWKGINRSVKSVRDKFGAPIPEFHDPGMPFTHTPGSESGSAQPIQPESPVVVNGSPNQSKTIGPPKNELNLTSQEVEALNNAKSSLAFLRNPPEQYKEALASALEKTKKANPGTLYRGMRISQDDLDKMLKNGYPIDVHTMSSPDRESASRFAQGFDNKVPVVLQMEGTKSANMAHGYTGDQLPKEKSAVLSPGQKYNVTGTEDISIPGEKAWMDPFSGKLIKMSRQESEIPALTAERRGPNRPTQEEWNSMDKPKGVTADTPLSEHPEMATIHPESLSPSSVAKEPTELAEKRILPGGKKAADAAEADYQKSLKQFKNPDSIVPFSRKDSDPNFKLAKNYKDNVTPQQRRADIEEYKSDVKSLSDEFSAGKEARKRDNERALRLAEEVGPVQRPYITKEGLEKEMGRREWGSPRGNPDKHLTKEIYDQVEAEAAKRFGVKPGEADKRAFTPTVAAENNSSVIEDLGDSSVEEIASDGVSKSEAQEIVKKNAARFTPKEEPVNEIGAEEKLDAHLLKRDIADQAKLDGVPNPLADNTAVAKKDTPIAILEDGTVVHGLSAVQRKNHLMLKELDDIEKALGTGTEESAHRKVLGYKTGEGRPYTDKVIAQEADELGLRQQLEEIPATREYPGLRARAFAGGGEGPMNTLKDFLGFRLDPVLGAIAGESRNPYTAMPNTPAGRIQQYLFRQGVPLYPLLEQKGGLGAARFADDYADRNREKK